VVVSSEDTVTAGAAAAGRKRMPVSAWHHEVVYLET
jgi:hypothetical protein